MDGFFASIGKGATSAGKAVAGFFRGIFDWLSGKKSREFPEPKIPYPRQTLEADEDGNEYGITEDEFIHTGEWLLTPTSTNVYGFQYDIKSKTLTVGYVGWANQRNESKLRFYEYFDISADEAGRALGALSKGGWVWRNLRDKQLGQPGTKAGHRKQFIYSHAENDWAYQRKKPTNSPHSNFPGARRKRGF